MFCSERSFRPVAKITYFICEHSDRLKREKLGNTFKRKRFLYGTFCWNIFNFVGIFTSSLKQLLGHMFCSEWSFRPVIKITFFICEHSDRLKGEKLWNTFKRKWFFYGTFCWNIFNFAGIFNSSLETVAEKQVLFHYQLFEKMKWN